MEMKAVLVLKLMGNSIYMGRIQPVVLRPRNSTRTLGMPARM